MILPGGTLGILGGGQLARMLSIDARRMGYRTVVWSGTPTAEPTIGVSDLVILKPFDDAEALVEFCSQVDVATVEFENIPLETLRAVEEKTALYPSSESIGVSQHRSREKTFLSENFIPCAPYAMVNSLSELEAAYAKVGPTGVLKTAAFGYDGKGQVKLTAADQLAEAWETVGGQPSVLEGFVDFDCEISVLVARGAEGKCVSFPPVENQHRHHILDFTIAPARVGESVLAEAQSIAERLAEALDYRGLLAVEFFVEKSGRVLVNEMAPRPHNSGHFSMNGCVTSQFEQQLRAVVGLPLGSTELLSPTVMVNLLGDMWHGEPRTLDTSAILATEGAKLHLYGKAGPGERRKLGHVNLVGGEGVLARAEALKEKLLSE
ncbi:5-(carboxyamino)imidazole ribonucleotide synthase [Akkermansiaceae bacterium]|nr:5-(carboxyamino)imidazole ribonucleotide synthase [Akkermansiaceae bacterium]